MKTNTIITISRQYGAAEEKSGRNWRKSWRSLFMIKNYCPGQPRTAVSARSFLRIMMKSPPTVSCIPGYGHYSFGYTSSSFTDMPINQKIFLAQFNAIKAIANEGPCVIVGRCADYALEEYSNCISVYIHSSMKNRIRRIAQKYDLTDAKAKDRITKTDKKRASYYNYSAIKNGATPPATICALTADGLVSTDASP